MAPEMKENIIIPVAPSDVGDAAARNTNAITNYIQSAYGKMGRLISKVRAKSSGRIPVGRLLVQLQLVVVVVQEHELGKLVFSLGAPLTIGLIITDAGKTQTATWWHYVLMGLSSGCELIFTGILLRTAFPTLAKVMEHTGIALVITSFNGLVASALPPNFAWLPMLSASLGILPLVISVLPNRPPAPAADIENAAPPHHAHQLGI